MDFGLGFRGGLGFGFGSAGAGSGFFAGEELGGGLDGVDEEPGLLAVDGVFADAGEDLVDGEEHGGAIFEDGRFGDGAVAPAAGVVVVVAEVFAAEGG
jgi:hypothetical protein